MDTSAETGCGAQPPILIHVLIHLESEGMPTSIRSYSKINLGLAIGPVRPDGFHGLTTFYQTLELHDLVTIDARRAGRTSITITSNDKRVPLDLRNTAWKMTELALNRLNVAAEVSI